jgi:hypothetical protein
VFYLSKVYKLGDTLLILLAMCYLKLTTRQSLMPIVLVTNTVAASIGSRFFQDSHDLCECHPYLVLHIKRRYGR